MKTAFPVLAAALWVCLISAGQARYVQSDPKGLTAGVSTYAYVKANPLQYIDPQGLEAIGPLYDPKVLGEWGRRDGQYVGGLVDFARNYRAMRSANTIGADKYFHCKANCEAASRGAWGFAAACNVSNAREKFDQVVKGDPASASAEDQVANIFGRRNAGSNQCAQVCSPFRPNGLSPIY